MSNNAREKYYKLVSNTMLFALGNFGSKILVFLLVPLYTNMLTTAEYGVSEIVLTGVNLFIPFVSVSIQDATLRFALDKKNNKDVVLKNTMAVLFVGAIVTCFLYPAVNKYNAIKEWSSYFIIITIVYMYRNALSVYLKAIGKSTLFAIDSIAYTAILMITNILFLAVFKWGLKGYFIATIFSSTISIIFLLYFGKVLQSCWESKLNGRLLKEMIAFSIPLVLNNVSWWVISSSDKIMIERMLSINDSGVYSVAAKMPSLITTITSIFNQAWVISSVTEYDSSKDKSFFSNIFNAFNFILVIFSSFAVAVIKPFMQVYVGEDFVESWRFVPLLLLGSIFQAYATFFGAIYTSVKKNISVMITTILAAGINIILNVLLIPTIGIQGAVISTAVAYLIVFLFRMLDSRKYFEFKIDFSRVISSNIILIIQCVCVISDVYPNMTSAICFILLLVINYKSLILLMKSLYKSLRIIVIAKGEY